MTRRALILIAGLALVPAIRLAPIAPAAESAVSRLPKEISGQDFWKLSTELSEPDGYFRSDNLVSNEVFMQRVIPELVKIVKPGRVYLGVGPEQNFTYMAAINPAMAFIVDIRRGNLQLHLMYKALFELSADRAEFVSRLFSLRRPAGLGRNATVQEIFTAYNDPGLRSDDLYKQNVAAMRDLFQRKKIALSADDLSGVERVYEEFFTRGPSIHYEVTPGSAGSFPTYVEVMIATDDGSVQRSFLSSEDRFQTLRDLHARNMIVPVVGNFAGPKAIRAIGTYVKRHGALVGAFYVSNVEQYLLREGGIDKFCASAAMLPLDESSTFIRSERGGFAPRAQRWPGGFGAGFTSQLHNIREDVRSCGR
jgi:hypothetical protein